VTTLASPNIIHVFFTYGAKETYVGNNRSTTPSTEVDAEVDPMTVRYYSTYLFVFNYYYFISQNIFPFFSLI
jgi:hypothetical protein